MKANRFVRFLGHVLTVPLIWVSGFASNGAAASTHMQGTTGASADSAEPVLSEYSPERLSMLHQILGEQVIPKNSLSGTSDPQSALRFAQTEPDRGPASPPPPPPPPPPPSAS